MARALAAVRIVAASLVILFSAAMLDLAGHICPEAKLAYCQGIALGMQKVSK